MLQTIPIVFLLLVSLLGVFTLCEGQNDPQQGWMEGEMEAGWQAGRIRVSGGNRRRRWATERRTNLCFRNIFQHCLQSCQEEPDHQGYVRSEPRSPRILRFLSPFASPVSMM